MQDYVQPLVKFAPTGYHSLYHECPCCGAPYGEATPLRKVPTLRRCRKCRAIYGFCYNAEFYQLVRPQWAPPRSQPRQYVDVLRLDGFGGSRRWHGWVDSKGRIVQVG